MSLCFFLNDHFHSVTCFLSEYISILCYLQVESFSPGSHPLYHNPLYIMLRMLLEILLILQPSFKPHAVLSAFLGKTACPSFIVFSNLVDDSGFLFGWLCLEPLHNFVVCENDIYDSLAIVLMLGFLASTYQDGLICSLSIYCVWISITFD